MAETRISRRKQSKGSARRRESKPRNASKGRRMHPVQRWFVTILLTIVAVAGIGIAGLQSTAMNANFTTKALTTGDNLTTIESKVQSAAGSSLTNIPGASTIVSQTVSKATTKAVVAAAVADIYDNTTAQIDFTSLDSAVRNALSASTSGISSALGGSIATAILPSLHSYLNTQLSTQTAKAKQSFQQLKSTLSSVTLPLTIIAAVLAIWLLLVAGGIGRFLHALGWVGVLAGIIGTLGIQFGSKTSSITSLADSAGDFKNVVLSYVATVVNHISGYYLITAGVGLFVLLITIPFLKRR